jgi:hypothetical protein
LLSSDELQRGLLAGGRERLAELERYPPDVAIVETLLDLV